MLARVLRDVDEAFVVALERWPRDGVPDDEDDDPMPIPDDRLALIFACCHPALAADRPRSCMPLVARSTLPPPDEFGRRVGPRRLCGTSPKRRNPR